VKRLAQLTRSGRSIVAMLTRLPVAGAVKTRLMAALGPAGAARLHRELTEHVALELAALGATGEAGVEVWHDGGTRQELRQWLGPLPRYRAQPRGPLGVRLAAVLAGAAASGARRCVTVGSDCPGMTADHLRRALAALDDVDLVLGPALDGGYWLIGLRADAVARALPHLFVGVSWSTSAVLEQTLARAAAARLSTSLLEPLADVDRPEDLPVWERARDRPPVELRLSVVIPALDEADRIAGTVRAALAGPAAEVVVADGGSTDRTRELAAAAGARVIQAPRGRARQLAAGAAHATGDALLFLHADTRPAPDFAAPLGAALGRRGVVAGAFSYRASARGPLGLAITRLARLRYELSGYPYGDQGLFLRRRTFRALGGFPELPVMEDWELVRRLRRLGHVVVLPEEAVTSSEAFLERGLVRSGLVTLAVVTGYQLGIDPERLAAWRARVARRATRSPLP
jgi:uncharacterized protein